MAILLGLFVVGCGREGRPANDAAPRSGKWKRAAAESSAQVQALPYARGYAAPLDAQSGVILYDRARAFSGSNLLCSGHAAEALLFAMDGRPLHRWAMPIAAAFPELAGDAAAAKVDYWRRVRMTDDGGLLAIYEGFGIVKLDRASRRVWARRGNFHHDLDVAADGSIWVLDREGKVLPRIHPSAGVLEDFATRLTPEGEIAERVSILEAFESSPFAASLADMPRQGDILHTNTLEVLDGSLAATVSASCGPKLWRACFAAGNLLVSVLQTSTLAVVDPRSRRVVWALRGSWRKQHQPTVLRNGHLLLFDNTGVDRDHSRVLEIDPADGEVVWSYGGSAIEPLASRTLGSAQRLGNGNTLITESERGRALEVTPDKRVVWEYRSPYRTGENDALVAALLEVVRLDGSSPP